MAEEFEIITDAEMADLPDDGELAFVAYEKRLRVNTRDKAPDEKGTGLEREYANHLLAFINVYDLDVPVDTQPPYDDDQFWGWYQRFVQDIDYQTVKLRLAHARSAGSGVTVAVSLSDDCRTKIHGLLERVRKVVNQADFPDAKKDAIYSMVAALQYQVDRSETRFDAFLSRFLDLTNAVGDGADKLEPAVKLLERVVKVFGHAKADQDTAKLPPPAETPKLPGPNSGQKEGGDLEDEVPF